MFFIPKINVCWVNLRHGSVFEISEFFKQDLCFNTEDKCLPKILNYTALARFIAVVVVCSALKYAKNRGFLRILSLVLSLPSNEKVLIQNDKELP